jgi:hypothetical protein
MSRLKDVAVLIQTREHVKDWDSHILSRIFSHDSVGYITLTLR